MQRDLNLENYVVYPAKVDRYPGGDRYEGGPLPPHHAVHPLGCLQSEDTVYGLLACMLPRQFVQPR